MKIGIGGAAYITNDAHRRMAEDALESMVSDEHELSFCFWMNNVVDTESLRLLQRYGHAHQNNENSVSRAWNRAIDCLLRHGCDYVLVPNLDIVVGPGSIDSLVGYANRNPVPVLWTMAPWFYRDREGDTPGIEEAPLRDQWQPHPHFSCFMVDDRLFELVGPFDENIKPAYDEDLDMHWRIRLAGLEAGQYEGARFFHVGSGTIKADPELMDRNKATHRANDEYFVRKWGFKPPTADDPFTDGMYRFPFDDPSRVDEVREFTRGWR